ncbi:MAG TPA: redoxin domain-containing protein [Bacteroidales bacterium]
MNRIFLLTFLLIQSLFVLPQNNKISGTIPGLVNQDVYLMKMVAENRTIIDTTATDATGSFIFELPSNFPVGQYAVVSGPSQMIELIYNNENIRFVTTGANPNDQVQIAESVENQIYYEYLYTKGITLYKTDLLEPLLQNYPTDDPFFKTIIAQYNLLKENLDERVITLVEQNPETFAAQIIQTDKPLLPDPTLTSRQQKVYLKLHYFDETNFADTLLTRTNILSSKVVGYLSLFQEENMTKQQLENSLLVGLDTILNKAAVNQEVYEYIVDFLINGFQAIGFENGLEYIAEHNQLDQFCVNTERKKVLENKIELINKLAIGKPAPDFETVDLKGKMMRLSDVGAEKTVLIFWASWCQHCDEIMPVIKEYYNSKNKRELEVVAVSIDNSRNEVETAIEKNGYGSWINIAELQGWEGKIVDEYGIAATPTIFILDKNKTIIAKPGNIDELKKMLTAS